MLPQRRHILGMDQRADIFRRYVKGLWIDAEDPILSLIPAPLVGRRVPIPGPHLTRRKSKAPALFALQQSCVRGFQLRRAFSDVALQFQVELLQLASLAMKLDEYPYFRAQHFGNDRHRDIVHRAHRITTNAVDIGQVNRRNEDDRRFFKARMLPQHGSKLEAIEFRHADVDQNDRDLVLEQELQCFARRRRLDEVLAKLSEDYIVGEQLIGLVVDQEHINFIGHEYVPPSDAATSAARTEAVRC